MLETILVSVTSFIGTNIDDLLIDMLFFAGAKAAAQRRSVVAGKYLGIGILVAVSVLGAAGLQFLTPRLLGFLGLVPILLGIGTLISGIKQKKDGDNDAPEQGNGGRVFQVAAVTIANGADNLGVYIPLFAGFRPWQILLSIGVFGLMIALWCFAGKLLAKLPVLRNVLEKYRYIIVPTVFILLGVYILLQNFR